MMPPSSTAAIQPCVYRPLGYCPEPDFVSPIGLRIAALKRNFKHSNYHRHMGFMLWIEQWN